MITCNRCGKANPAGAISCQKCGAPLATDKQEYVLGSRMSAQDQPELPAWLESLRAGERPAASSASPSSFSAEDLIDGGSLPSWMRPERSDASDPGLSGPQSVVRPSTFAAPNTDSGYMPSQGIDAGSLIDEQSLPAWMQPEKPQSNIAANSLVQSEFVPDWLKAMQAPAPAQPPLQQPQRPAQQPQQPQGRPTSFAGPSAPMSAAPAQGQRPLPSQGFSARDLVDDQALPEWMLHQQSQGGQGSVGAPGGLGQQSFSASSLIDNEAVPQWMRESGQGQAPLRANQPPASSFNNAVWQGPPPLQTPPPGGMPGALPQSDMQGQGASISASSFIDPNVLPEWLRGAEDSPGERRPGQARPGVYGGVGAQGRVENVRVPSRPRAEVGPSGDSEAAASAFASMLGVASNAPQFSQQPGQGQNAAPMASGMYGSPSGQVPSAPQRMPPSAPSTPGGYAGTGSQPAPGYMQGMQPQGYMGTGPQPTPGYMGTGPQPAPGYMGQGAQSQGYQGTGPQPATGGYNSGYMGNAGNMGSVGVAQGGYGTAMPPMGPQGQQGPGNATGYMGQGGPDDQRMNAKPAKRGLFDAIRSLFFRS